MRIVGCSVIVMCWDLVSDFLPTKRERKKERQRQTSVSRIRDHFRRRV